ncbi:expressed protein [Phakopsora pachyrhizi]|uniref:Expressed protein n=1 Tax=Phakopsora pachyrhizi TaxID=170000 RepID=A0AAV0AQ53_PHAPC|nr:expressed protein [Phakopsora pachyrhizi]CAH7669933.1 expressed protein [Phakopsora pachyrhizi]
MDHLTLFLIVMIIMLVTPEDLDKIFFLKPDDPLLGMDLLTFFLIVNHLLSKHLTESVIMINSTIWLAMDHPTSIIQKLIIRPFTRLSIIHNTVHLPIMHPSIRLEINPYVQHPYNYHGTGFDPYKGEKVKKDPIKKTLKLIKKRFKKLFKELEKLFNLKKLFKRLSKNYKFKDSKIRRPTPHYYGHDI